MHAEAKIVALRSAKARPFARVNGDPQSTNGRSKVGLSSIGAKKY
jgi:hypothetical protein